MEDIQYYYLVISSIKPERVKEMEKSEALEWVGLYDGEHFSQPVKCEKCKGDVYVMFNDFGEPEFGQCMDCGGMVRLYYTRSRYFLGEWYESDIV